jgi:hypothetical protein
MRCRVDLALIASGLCACSDATGSLAGGQLLALPAVSASGAEASGASGSGTGGSGNGGSGSGSSGAPAGTPTWTYLYDTYFGQTTSEDGGTSYGLAACGLAISCHQLATDPGATTVPPKSGFVCGTTSDECYQGLLNATPPLVTPGDAGTAADPMMAPLYQALWNGSTPGNCLGAGVCKNNMPFTLVYHFTPANLALIALWIQNGAANN